MSRDRFRSWFEVEHAGTHRLVGAIRRRYPKAILSVKRSPQNPRIDIVTIDGVDRDVWQHEMREYRPRGPRFYFRRR